MKNIQVQIVQHLRPGGIETLSLEFCQQTDSKVVLVSLEGTKKQALKDWPRLKPFADQLYFLNKGPGLSLCCVWRLMAVLRHVKPSVIHTHHIGPMLYGGLAARLSSRAALVHTEHDAWHLNLPRHKSIVGLCLALFRPKLVADAQAVAEQLVQQFPKYPCHVIENGINTRVFNMGSQQLARRELQLPQHVRLIGCAARLQPVKGHISLLKAMTLLPQQVHLALAGDGPLREQLVQFCRHHGLTDRVHFLGHIDEMPAFYQALDVFCLPSLQEGMPLSALEAQACGKPVVLTDVGGCSQCIGPGSGLLVPPADPQQLAKALLTMLNRPACTVSRTYVVQHRSVDAMLRRYENLAGVKSQAVGG